MSVSTAKLEQQIRQFLVHSFLYYQMDESLIDDTHYDQICQALLKSLSVPPQPLPIYWDLLKKSLGQEGSGYRIKQYPVEIMSVALHLLYQERYSLQMSYETFLQRSGYSLPTA